MRGRRPVCHESQAGIISSPYDKKIVPQTQLFIKVIGILASKVVIRKLHARVISVLFFFSCTVKCQQWVGGFLKIECMYQPFSGLLIRHGCF